MDYKIKFSFSPQKNIVNPKEFAGRRGELKRAIEALLKEDCSILVYGDRGVGKTSFIQMIKLIAEGNRELLVRHKLDSIFPSELFKFKVVTLVCSKVVNSTTKILKTLLTSPDGLLRVVKLNINGIQTEFANTNVVNFFRRFEKDSILPSEVLDKDLTEDDIFELFVSTTSIISKQILSQDETLVIILDEFDMVRNNKNMASLIKVLSGNRIKFVMSGISQSYEELLKDHESIRRQLLYGKIKIDPMTAGEIEDVFKLAEMNSNGVYSFSPNFLKQVVEMSHGYPYYVQLFGDLAIKHFHDTNAASDKIMINTEQLKNSLKYIVEYEPLLDKMYLKIINNKPEREMMLKALAIQSSKKIVENDVVNYCNKRNVPKAKPIISHLLGFKNPLILHRLSKDYVCFVDPLFKIYARSRPPEFLEGGNGDYNLRTITPLAED